MNVYLKAPKVSVILKLQFLEHESKNMKNSKIKLKLLKIKDKFERRKLENWNENKNSKLSA